MIGRSPQWGRDAVLQDADAARFRATLGGSELLANTHFRTASSQLA
jgi:hypothetical protein